MIFILSILEILTPSCDFFYAKFSHFFNIYGINCYYFSSRTVIIRCLRQSLSKDEARFEYFPFDFISFYLFVLTFAMKLKDSNYKSHFSILRPMKKDSISCFISMVWVHFSHKTEKFRF